MTRIDPVRVISERHYQAGISVGFLQGFCAGAGMAALIYWLWWRAT